MTIKNGQATKDPLTNGHQENATAPPRPTADSLAPKFVREQAVLLKQSSLWSRGIVWGIIGVTVASIIWAAVAKIEQVIPARGQLKPQGEVKEIQAPLNGVVEKVFVKNGDRVKKGQMLVRLDSTASRAELASKTQVRQSLAQQNQFYRAALSKSLTLADVERAAVQLKLSQDKVALVRDRLTYMAENQLYKIQLGSARGTVTLTAEQTARLRAANNELGSRAAMKNFEVAEAQKELQKNQVQLADAKMQLLKDRQVLAEIQQRNLKGVKEAERSLAIDENILETVEPLMEEGALAKLQVERQKQSIYDRQKQMIEQKANGSVELQKQQQQVQSRLAEIDRLQEEEKRLRYSTAKAGQDFINTLAFTEKDVRDKIAANDQKIAEIDTLLTKTIAQNENQIADLDSNISAARVTLKYQEIKAPVSGTVFDLKATPGYVPQSAQAAQSDPMLKIVPDDYLVAEVNITNQDIGFVRKGMKADVRIDSFPYSEFGDIKGKVSWIGSDALKPDEIEKYYRFPTKITLDSQTLKAGERGIPLQSGMSVTANIKVRENRTVMSLFWETFTGTFESLEQVR
jgi:HlyD family secretion protein